MTRLAAVCLLGALLAGCSFPGAGSSAPVPSEVQAGAMASQYMTNVRFVAYDPFDSLRNWSILGSSASLSGGQLELRGAPGWHGSFWSRQHFADGQGLTLRFQLDRANAQSEFVLVTGDWQTDSFRQFGVYNAVTPKGDLFLGKQNLGGYDLTGNLQIMSGTWYDVLLAIGRNGHFLALVWDPQHTDHRVFYDLQAGPDWAGRGWVFLPKANSGETVLVDDYYRFTLGDIR